MKRYIIVILLIGVILGSVLIYNTMEVEQRIYKTFDESGYILQSKQENENEVERYYFSGEQKYKENYNKQITFEDTNGNKVVTNKDNFIHYTDGSISAFKNGVLVELTEIESDPIFYYNILANSTLTKLGDKYTIKNLDKQLSFTYPLWKISANKYLLAGTEMKIVFEDGTEKIINGYLEIEYSDNKVVKIYNQEITYQTIGEETTIYLSEDIEIKLGSKIISKNGENQMSFENMVIDSEDNVTIVDIGDKKEEEEEEEEQQIQIPNNQNGGTTNNNQQSTNQNDSNQNNNSTNLPQINGNGTGDISGIVDHNPDVIQAPKFKVTSFDVSSTGLITNISITDEEALLKEDTKVKVIRAETGKIIYENSYPVGEYEISLDVQSLSPNTEYILQVETGYQVEDIVYQKNFIHKSFRTNIAGISLEKDVFTNTSMSFKVDFEPNTQITRADLKLIGANGQEIQEKVVDNPSNVIGGKVDIEFTGLEPNTEYEVKLTNVLYDGRIVVNAFDIIQKHMTLKNRPTISELEYEIDKREGKFILKILNVEDVHKAIEGYRYEIYDSRKGIDAAPVKTIESDKTEVILPVENEKTDENGTVQTIEGQIIRNVKYHYKVIANYNDNEKICETESEYSNQMSMDGVEAPTVRFQEEKVTFERIEGLLIIEDNGNAVMTGEDSIIHVTYSDSLGNTETITSQGSLNIPISINNLRANETYKFAVYGKVDLKDGNDPIDEYYIGGAVVRTAEPEPFKAVATPDATEGVLRFNINFKLDSKNPDSDDLEAKTLTGLEFRIYSGQPDEAENINGTLKGTVTLVDENEEFYESTLKEQFYDNSVQLTPSFFGKDNTDFTEKYYTITVSKAHDYTKYENVLPIEDSVIKVETASVMPTLPEDPEEAISVTPITNMYSENRSENLQGDTIVGYKVQAKFDNSEKIARKIIYRAYNTTQSLNKEVDVKEEYVSEDGIIPSVIFDVKEGTRDKEDLEGGLKRGNNYYFTYEIYFDLESDGKTEKYEISDIRESKIVETMKEKPQIFIYPWYSSADGRTYKYKMKDVDKALTDNVVKVYKGNQVEINSPILSSYTLEETGDEFSIFSFNGLSEGNICIQIKQARSKNYPEEGISLGAEYFEGENEIKNLRYSITEKGNYITIKLHDNDQNPEIEKIAAFQVQLIPIKDNGEADGEIVMTELKVPSSENTINVNLHEKGISELVNKKVEVNLIAYYDTGMVGYYDEEENPYILLQKPYLSNEQKNYYALNDNGNLGETPSAKGNLYVKTKDPGSDANKFGIVNAVEGDGNKQKNIELTYTSEGMKDGSNVVLQKKVLSEVIDCKDENNNTITINRIIPGISLKNSKGELAITSGLNTATITANLIVTDEDEINDKKIYIELYEKHPTENIGDAEDPIKTIEKTVSDFEEPVEIGLEDLKPKNPYAIRFYTKMNGKDEKVYLDDVDYEETGRIYRFETLTDVGISVKGIEFIAKKYNQKCLKLTYGLEKIRGYNVIEYKITKENVLSGKYEEIPGLTIEEDTEFKEVMEKEIAINPGSPIELGAKYRIEIKPKASIKEQDGSETAIELNSVPYDFELDKLTQPTSHIRGTRADEDGKHRIKYRVTITDTDRAIMGDSYKIQVLKNDKDDVTSNVIDRQENYEVDINHKEIVLDNADKNRKYTIRILADVDYNNDGVKDSQYIDEYPIQIAYGGISIGTISVTKNTEEKIDILFSDSYKIHELTKIKYSIYNNEGNHVHSGTVEEPINDYGAGIYKCSLEGKFEKGKTYSIRMQFIKIADDGEEIIVDNRDGIQYVYQ